MWVKKKISYQNRIQLLIVKMKVKFNMLLQLLESPERAQPATSAS